MNVLAMHLVGVVIADEKTESAKEKQETATTEENPSVGHTLNMFNYIHRKKAWPKKNSE